MPNSIPISSLYTLSACITVSNSFSFLANSLMSSMYIRCLFVVVFFFFLLLIKFVSAYAFSSIWLSGIIAFIIIFIIIRLEIRLEITLPNKNILILLHDLNARYNVLFLPQTSKNSVTIIEIVGALLI